MDRVEHYLERILNNPGYWIRISKQKGHHLSKNNKFKERQIVIEQIAAALTLMGIKYERLNGTKFRIPPPPKVEYISPTGRIQYLGVDLAKANADITQRLLTTGSVTYMISGNRPTAIIIDDIYKDPP